LSLRSTCGFEGAQPALAFIKTACAGAVQINFTDGKRTPSARILLKKFDEIKTLGLLDKIRVIAPSHGQIWTDPAKIISAYTDWATGKARTRPRSFTTRCITAPKRWLTLAEGLIAGGADGAMYVLRVDERSEVVEDILDSKIVLFGAPTPYSEPYPSLGDLVYYLPGLRFDKTGQKKLAITFGSMGGLGGAPKKLAEDISACGFEVVQQLEVYFVPTEDELIEYYEVGTQLASRIKT